MMNIFTQMFDSCNLGDFLGRVPEERRWFRGEELRVSVLVANELPRGGAN